MKNNSNKAIETNADNKKNNKKSFLSIKNKKLLTFGFFGTTAIVGLIVFAVETDHYWNYIRIHNTATYYNQGVANLNAANNTNNLEQIPYNDFAKIFNSTKLNQYKNDVNTFFNDLDNAAKLTYANNSDSYSAFVTNYIQTGTHALNRTISESPQIAGFCIGVIIFIVSIGTFLILFMTRNVGKNKRAEKSKKVKFKQK
ncbi:MAG: hypothetical protein HUJ42_02995 [Malacoplasma sp.]|nr:hypothetical protein [Malacoplasma sp.]